MIHRGPLLRGFALSLAALIAALLVVGFAQPGHGQTLPAPSVAPASYDGEVSGRLERILQRSPRGRLIVGVKTDYAPWGMFGDDGEIVGLEPDLARDLARRLSVELQLESVSTANRQQRLEGGRVDIIIATMGDTEVRRELSDLLQPHYFSSGVRLLADENLAFTSWGQLRGRTVCLVDGAYFNRVLVERYLLRPLVFQSNREALLALADRRCAGLAYDDTVLARLVRDGEAPGLALRLPPIETTPWTIAVSKGEGSAPLGRFVADTIADWHRSGLIAELEVKWGLPPTEFVARQAVLWSEPDDTGAPRCRRGPDGEYPADCLSDRIARSGVGVTDVPDWAVKVGGWLRLSPDLLFDSYTRSQLVGGLGMTVLLSGVAIVGALAFGVLLGWLDAALGQLGRSGWLLRGPLLGLFAVARMTPPILQLYLVFFGLGALMANSYAITPGAFITAAFVFSLYAGSANAVLISQSLLHLKAERPEASLGGLLPAASERVFDGLMSSCVNIVKAAGMASTIAVAELISVANTLVADGGDARTVMNLLLVFYFFFVLFVVWMFGALRRRLAAHRNGQVAS